MQTDVNVSDIIKKERRKVFLAMNTLPWISVVILLTGIAIHFYKKSLNVILPSPKSIVNTVTNISSYTEVDKDVDKLYEFQVSAVFNGFAEWTCDVKGNRSFKWKNAITNYEQSTHGIPIPPNREYPFTLSDMELARGINLNIEQEIVKLAVNSIEFNFIGKNSKSDKELKQKIQFDLSKSIKEFFDGFETYNRENKRR